MTDTTPRKTGDADAAEAAPPAALQDQAQNRDQAQDSQSLAGRVRRSFLDSAGSIVFGMEDRDRTDRDAHGLVFVGPRVRHFAGPTSGQSG